MLRRVSAAPKYRPATYASNASRTNPMRPPPAGAPSSQVAAASVMEGRSDLPTSGRQQLTPVFNSRLDTSGPRRSGAHRSIIDFDQGLACSILVMIRLPPACPAIPPSAVGSDVRMTARSESVVGASTSTTSAP